MGHKVPAIDIIGRLPMFIDVPRSRTWLKKVTPTNIQRNRKLTLNG